MGTFGRLHGLASPLPRESTILELGCGDGANLLAIAARFPTARCIGVDASPRAVGLARKRQAALGLTNLTLIEAPLEAVCDASPLPPCDYVIAHGVLSWVSPDVRAAIFRLIGRVLAPAGVAMLSFLTAPGQHDLAPLVTLMRHHVATVADLGKKVAQARDMALWQLDRTRRLHGEARARLLGELVDEIMAMPDAVLLHDLLSPERHALSISIFEQSCRAQGLQWLTNARMNEPRTALLPENLRDLVRATPDPVRRQAYLDCFLMTRFRTALVCRDQPVTRAVDPDAFAPYLVASRLAPEALGPHGVIETAVGRLTLSEAAAALIAALAPESPAPRALDELGLPLDRETLCAATAELWLADAVELSLAPPEIAHPEALGPFPRASRLARAIAAEGRDSATSLWHREHALDDHERATLIACDGTRARSELASEPLKRLARMGFLARD
jgi:SAM-dependent methyltransferase